MPCSLHASLLQAEKDAWAAYRSVEDSSDKNHVGLVYDRACDAAITPLSFHRYNARSFECVTRGVQK